jgi:hypothetical protein
MTRHGAALLALSIIASAGWAYNVNYDTRAVLDRLSTLRTEIAEQREALQVLRVEWAYLNAPDRLAGLVAKHNDVLGLVPLVPEALGIVAAIPYPPRETPEPPAPEALIAAAPMAPADAGVLAPVPAGTLIAAAPSSAAAGDGAETMTVAMRGAPGRASHSNGETVPPALEAAIAAALSQVGVPLEDEPRGVPPSGVIAIPADPAAGMLAAAAPGAPVPAMRPVAWSRP